MQCLFNTMNTLQVMLGLYGTTLMQTFKWNTKAHFVVEVTNITAEHKSVVRMKQIEHKCHWILSDLEMLQVGIDHWHAVGWSEHKLSVVSADSFCCISQQQTLHWYEGCVVMKQTAQVEGGSPMALSALAGKKVLTADCEKWRDRQREWYLLCRCTTLIRAASRYKVHWAYWKN